MPADLTPEQINAATKVIDSAAYREMMTPGYPFRIFAWKSGALGVVCVDGNLGPVIEPGRINAVS